MGANGACAPLHLSPCMNPTRKFRRSLWAALLIPAALAPVLAQPPAAPSAAAKEEVLTLPEFSVETSAMTDSYTAGDTVSASRMNASVKDLPYSVASLTNQFLEDFAVFDLNDDLSYISGITGNTDAFTYGARGYNSANVALFNGHYMFNPLVAPFVDRVEYIKGPAASLYGQSSPGGALLITTRQPTAQEKESLSLSAGTAYDLRATQLHASGPVPIGTASPHLFYNVDAEYLHRTFDVHYARRQEKAVEAGLLYKIDENTNVSFEAVWQKYWNPNAGDWGLPLTAHFANNPFTGKTGQLYYDGFAWPLRNQYYGSTTDYVTREASTWYATFQHRFSDWLSLEAGYSHYVTPVETYNTLGSSGVYFPSVNLVASGSAASGTNNVNAAATANPAWSTTMGTGYSYNLDLLAHFHVLKADDQLLFTVDDYLNNRRNYTETPIAGEYTPYVWAFNPYQPVTSPYVPRDSNHFAATTTLNNAVNSLGFGLNDRASWFDNKLILTFGYRHDHYTGYQLNPSAATTAVSYTGADPGSGRQSKIFTNVDGGNLGLTLGLTSNISWYASVYEAYSPFNTSVPLTVSLTGTTPAARAAQLKTLDPSPQRGVGEESGVKFDYLNHQLSFSADVFDTHQKNVSVTELSDPTNPSSVTISVPEGDQNAKGFEFQGEFDSNDHLWHAYLSYSYLDSEVTNQGIAVLANGRRPRGAPYDSESGAVTYRVPQLKGLSLLTSFRAQGNTPQQSPSTGGIVNPADGLQEANDGRMYLRTPSYIIWSFGAAYTWKTPGTKLVQNVNLTLKNAFNKVYVQPGSSTLFLGDGRGLYVTYTLRH